MSANIEENRKIRDIAIIIPSLTHHGGAERLALQSARYLIKLGHKITIYTHEYSLELLIENSCKDANVVLLSEHHNPHERFNLSPLKWTLEIGDHDLYITHLFPSHKIKVSPMIAYVHESFRLIGDLRHEIPIWEPSTSQIIDEYKIDSYFKKLKRGIQPPESIDYETIDQVNGFNPSIIVTNSYSTRSTLRGLYPLKDIDVIYPGVEFVESGRKEFPDYWPSKENIGRKFKILHVGAVAYLKRWRVLVDALANLPDVECTFVGQGPEIPYLQDAIQKYQMGDRVFVVGQISDNNMESSWHNHDALVMCSIREPFGMVALESAMRGLPVIIDQDSGVREVLNDACLVTDSTPIDLIKKINLLKSNTKLYDYLAKRAREISIEFTWDKFGEKLNKHIEQFSVKQQSLCNQTEHQALLGYCIDYGMSESHRFGEKTPVLGRYSSHEGWVIKRQMQYFRSLGLKNIAFKVKPISSMKIGEQLRVIQRVKNIVEEGFCDLSFALWIDLSSYCDVGSLQAIVNFWKFLNFKNKLSVNQKLVLVLTGGDVYELGIFKRFTEFNIFSTENYGLDFINNIKYQSCEFSNEIDFVKWINSASELTLYDSYNDYPSNRFFEYTLDGSNRNNHLTDWGLEGLSADTLAEFKQQNINANFANIPLSQDDKIFLKNSLIFLRSTGQIARKIWFDIDDVNIFISDAVALSFWERSENINHVLLHVEVGKEIIFTHYHLCGGGWAKFDIKIGQLISNHCNNLARIIIEVKPFDESNCFEYDIAETVLSICR